MKKNLKKKKGFTLIELIIVISIIVVLAAIAVPKYASIQKDAKVKADIATAKTIADAVTVLVAQGKLSETISPAVEIKAVTATTAGAVTVDDAAGVIGGYLQSIPTSAVYKGGIFKVSVESGIATIYMKPGIDGVKDIEVYPKCTVPYGSKVEESSGSKVVPDPAK